jgi:hypothetical protein
MEKLALGSRNIASGNGDALTDIMSLVEILLQKGDHAEALLYGRRALKDIEGWAQKALPVSTRLCESLSAFAMRMVTSTMKTHMLRFYLTS